MNPHSAENFPIVAKDITAKPGYYICTPARSKRDGCNFWKFVMPLTTRIEAWVWNGPEDENNESIWITYESTGLNSSLTRNQSE